MKKRIMSLLMASILVISMLAGCGSSTPTDGGSDAVEGEETEASDFKAGFVMIGDENDGYTYAFLEGIWGAMDTLGLTEENVAYKYNISEDESTYDAIVDLIDQGCNVVFTNSYGHQSFALQAAEDYPEVQIVALTGDNAAAADVANFSNGYNRVSEGRYVAGVVAGMKLQELDDAGELSDKNYDADGNVKIGYVGAYPYAEVVSGFTAFLLGIQSVYPNASMEVQYTNSWGDITAEKEAAIAMINDGCVIIGQHANTTGAPSACEEANQAGEVVYNIGYNIDMINAAPNAAMVSPYMVWSVYFTDVLAQVMDGKDLDVDWAQGVAEGAVSMTAYSDNCPAGAQEAAEATMKGIGDGSIHIFDIEAFTVGGEKVTSYLANVIPDDNYEGETEAISDGYFHEAEYRSSPYFDLRIDGITELN